MLKLTSRHGLVEETRGPDLARGPDLGQTLPTRVSCYHSSVYVRSTSYCMLFFICDRQMAPQLVRS